MLSLLCLTKQKDAAFFDATLHYHVCMRVSDNTVKEFKEILLLEGKRTVADADAREMAEELLLLYKALREPHKDRRDKSLTLEEQKDPDK